MEREFSCDLHEFEAYISTSEKHEKFGKDVFETAKKFVRL